MNLEPHLPFIYSAAPRPPELPDFLGKSILSDLFILMGLSMPRELCLTTQRDISHPVRC
jgi:hypothetical protein